jgi:hypothetical protein
MKIGHLFSQACAIKSFSHTFQLKIYALIADERADCDPRKCYDSYFAADRIAACLSVNLPVKGMKSRGK